METGTKVLCVGFAAGLGHPILSIILTDALDVTPGKPNAGLEPLMIGIAVVGAVALAVGVILGPQRKQPRHANAPESTSAPTKEAHP